MLYGQRCSSRLNKSHWSRTSEITRWSQVCLPVVCGRLNAYWCHQHAISATSRYFVYFDDMFCYPTICAAGINDSLFCHRRRVISSHLFALTTNLFTFLASSSLPPTVLVPLRDTRRCSRDRKPMPNPEIAITIHAHTDTSSRPSEDFELVRYPTHQPTDWKPSHRQEELPFYMTEDTSARRRVTHPPQGPTTPKRNTQWDDEYDGEGKDVYAKVNASQRYGGGGRVARRAPPPPPASIVRLCTASPSFPTPLNINSGLLLSHFPFSASLSNKT
jgi:hypothetical protein